MSAEGSRSSTKNVSESLPPVRKLEPAPPSLGGPLRYGIGVDGSSTVSGEIGYGEHTSVTAFGDALSVAARLQDLTKELECEALVSDLVMRLGEIDVADFPLYTAMLRGFERPVPIRIIRSLSGFGREC
jgi:adenylate cyclase